MNDGGPAIVMLSGLSTIGLDPRVHCGVTVRDWLAAHASENDIAAFYPAIPGGQSGLSTGCRVMARYAFADAMLAERAKQS